MKVLYAAGNNQNARIQLSRFLVAMQGSEHQIKVGAYRRSSPRYLNINWTLDSLLNIYDPTRLYLDNDNLQIYYQQVKQYAPDLVVSDLEYFTSYLANLLNLPLWQCSSSLLNYALNNSEKHNAKLFKYYARLVQEEIYISQRLVHLLGNSDRNLVYSHFGDLLQPPSLKDHFEWVRPYHQVGKTSVVCQHHLVALLPDASKQLLNVLKNYRDSVVFTHSVGERYKELLVKDMDHQEEYYCNLKNCSVVLCRGQASLLADAFYNGKHALVYPDYTEGEAVLSGQLSQHFGTASVIGLSDDWSQFANKEILPYYQSNIKHLHQYMEEA